MKTIIIFTKPKQLYCPPNSTHIKRLELAYKLIKDHSLSHRFSYQIIFDYAVNGLNIQSFSLAKNIVLKEFEQNKVLDSLLYLCCVAITELDAIKFARDIILKDIQSIDVIEKFKENCIYYGYVTNFFKGKYQIEIGVGGIQIVLPKDQYGALTLHDFIRYKLIKKNEKIAASDVSIVEKSLIYNLSKKYYYGDIFIGKLLNLKVETIDGNRVLLSSNVYTELIFVVLISEITDGFVPRITDYVIINKEYLTKVISFNKSQKKIYCTLKSILQKIDDIEDTVSLNNKINALKEKFSKV